MTIKQIIDLLINQGHSVTWRKRSDGGYLITTIDGEKYTGASGNVKAREITGQKLSEKRRVQLKRITRPKLAPLPKQVKSLQRKINKILKQKEEDGKLHEGRVKAKQLRQSLAEVGEEETIAKLHRKLRYQSGYAYEANVDYVIERIQMNCWIEHKITPEMQSVIDYLINYKYWIKEADISVMYADIYRWEEGYIEQAECARLLRATLHI